jgi:hypothetical protein
VTQAKITKLWDFVGINFSLVKTLWPDPLMVGQLPMCAAPTCGGRHRGFGRGSYWSYASKRMVFSENGQTWHIRGSTSCWGRGELCLHLLRTNLRVEIRMLQRSSWYLVGCSHWYQHVCLGCFVSPLNWNKRCDCSPHWNGGVRAWWLFINKGACYMSPFWNHILANLADVSMC